MYEVGRVCQGSYIMVGHTYTLIGLVVAKEVEYVCDVMVKIKQCRSQRACWPRGAVGSRQGAT